ncbi:hypothetical protein Cni_G01682 [Canna indica]|uniref:Uncharacterized protein n=1 Tax=Canna indica TaxID=4628 RepID=A0AAQ3JR55_9LILI|nr:hypothetical protein Cni_G01682 [Canna indica]
MEEAHLNSLPQTHRAHIYLRKIIQLQEMGGSSSCLFFLKPSKGCEEGERYVSRKIWPSDEDRGRWVGEPDVDRKASAFIAKFYQSRFTET